MAGRNEAEAPHILVVDDDIVHRMIICRVADKVGYQPVEAGSYEDAERLLAERSFHCVTLDLSLGRHGGIGILYLIRDRAPHAPVIIVSGSDDGTRAEAVDVAHRLGLATCEPLPKPVNLAELRHILADIKLRTDAGLMA